MKLLGEVIQFFERRALDVDPAVRLPMIQDGQPVLTVDECAHGTRLFKDKVRTAALRVRLCPGLRNFPDDSRPLDVCFAKGPGEEARPGESASVFSFAKVGKKTFSFSLFLGGENSRVVFAFQL